MSSNLTAYDNKLHLVKKSEFVNAAKGALEDMEDHAQLLHMNVMLKYQREEYQQQKFRFYITMISVIAILIAVNIQFKRYFLKKLFSKAFSWYDSRDGRLDATWPPANGPYSNFTMEDAAIAFMYPGYATLRNLQFSSIKISQSGAQFLIIMAEHFAEKMSLRDVHWAGSSQQTGLPDLESYLPRRKSMKDIWHAWNHPNNIWKRLYPSYDNFAGSAAIQEYLHDDSNNMIKSLFQGGLIAVAINNTKVSENGRDMVKHLLGQKISIPQQKCSPVQKLQAGIETFNTSMMIGTMALTILGPFLGVMRGASEAAKGALVVKRAIALYGATAGASIAIGVHAANSTKYC